ncbi:MAG: hypothetical protein P1S60_20975, partial [Anaerolineae bacterium]|nr:hypothetical protein [Anaerolineae bacterium]
MQVDIPLIDVHTHIGQLPGEVGDIIAAEDLYYICTQENVAYMLVSSASATTIGQHVATKEVTAMTAHYSDKLGGMLWINPHDPTWVEDVNKAEQAGFLGIKIHPVLDHYAVNRSALDAVFSCAR